MMDLTVAWYINNWTNQGPGSIAVACTIKDGRFDGYDERPGLGTNSGARLRYDTFPKFLHLLDLCRDCVKRIKAGPQGIYDRVRESVSIHSLGQTFYEYGSTSPRHRFADYRDPKGHLLVAMLIAYIDDNDPPPVEILADRVRDDYRDPE